MRDTQYVTLANYCARDLEILCHRQVLIYNLLIL